LEFLQVFVDKCHHGKEEKVLFPAMEEAGFEQEGGPIGVMLYEHEQGRSYVKGLKIGVEGYRIGKADAIAEIVSNAQKYGQLLAAHIDKENDVLYVMAERVLSADKMAEISKSFTRIEELEIGPNKHEEFHATLHALKDIYLT
ncbi:MAG TPA: hemerythrin, partial [Desulfosporosinus sp.]|nr:hemerythrin [Desulfosporosinus sp.]